MTTPPTLPLAPPPMRVATLPAGLDARYPIALLPVRIETRFAGNLLKVRIFPDEIFADTHEPGLTDAERTDGASYVAAMSAGADAERDAWRSLVQRWTAPRAAWIARASVKGGADARAESWTRAAQAILPDSWTVRAYRGASVYTKTIAAVKQPLALTLSPTPGVQVAVSDALTVDAELQWTISFDAAVAAGMATTIDLTKPDVPPRLPLLQPASIDLLVVVGLKSSSAPADGAAHLHALFDAHHYTRGFGFVAPGTPTSNTAEAPAGFPVDDPGGAATFAVERGQPLVTPAQTSADGVRFARALGLAPADGEQVAAVEHTDGAAAARDPIARAMNDALWPATFGYFMQQLMAPKFDDNTIASARAFFGANVRAGGPLPAFRIGRVPYGLLPVVSLARFQPDDPLPHALRLLRDQHFTPAVAQVPRLQPGSADPDGDLLAALAVDASCRRVRLRTLLGNDVTRNTAGWLGSVAVLDQLAREQARANAAQALLASFGLGADVRLGHLDPGAAADLLGAPLVTSAPLSETDGVSYLQWLHDRAAAHDLDSLKNDKLPGTERPLLYRVLRHALLVEMDRIGVRQLIAAKVIADADRPEVELVGLAAQPALTTYDRITRAQALPPFASQLAPYLQNLSALAACSSAELERRFGETLDACSHRLDAWITSLATARLTAMRSAAPAGCHVGAFGWVENVRPAAAQAPIGGYIHAPSAAHASAAAILRNGYLSRGGGASPYAVDLSSARVRDALALLDGVRQGAPLAALLGYRFERDLHDRKLDPLIAPLRKKFPLVAGKTPEGAGPTELVAAGSVVDGVALRAAWLVKTAPFAAAGDLPALTDAETTSFHAALDALDGAIDGVADLLTAESVFQAVRGNPAAAAASLDTLAAGAPPPEPEIARSPVGGAAFTQRLVVILDGSVAAPANATPRAAAEPFLDAWAGRLLGDLTQVACSVRLADGSAKSVTLAQLGLRPLDVLALSKPAAAAEIDRRVRDAIGAPDDAAIDYGAGAPHSFAEQLELARATAALLSGARALVPGDLVTPSDSASAPITDATAAQAVARARDALGRTAAAVLSLASALAPVAAALANAAGPAPTAAQLASLRTALGSTSLFGVDSYPSASATPADLAALAAAAQKEISARQASAPPLTGDAPALFAAATATAQALFGRDFLFLPKLGAPAATSVALAASPLLIGASNLPRQVLQQVARVRAGVGRWRTFALYGEALTGAPPSLEVAQLPTGQALWAAAPSASPLPGTLSLLVHRPTATPPNIAWAGFVVDEWSERIPSAKQSTSIAFRHETPVAEAPQAVLLAVPPTSAATWDLETVIDTVRETLALAKVRLVDHVDELRPFLPAIFLTGNTANEAVSTDFSTVRVAEPTIVRSA